MIFSYDEEYLPLAMRVFGDMLDYAVNTLEYDISEFYKMFLVSGMAGQFEIGNPTYVAGKNGCEVARIVICRCCGTEIDQDDIMYLDKSAEYWTGWALAYYQWKTGYSYRRINDFASISEICDMYYPLHEADISKFVEVMDEKKRKTKDDSKLKRLRMYANLSQAQLARESGVSVRQIQLFEQGVRDIHKTQAETLIDLAKALKCDCTELL